AAVALAVHVAGAMEHLLQRPERERDRFVARGRVTAHRRVEGTGVLVLDARRRDEGAVRALGGEALGLWGRGVRLCLRIRAVFEWARDGVGPTGREIIRSGPHGLTPSVTTSSSASSAISGSGAPSQGAVPERYFQPR